MASADPAFCPVLEVASVHGRFDWLAEDALRQGLRVGFICATDDHSGRPGTSPPTAQPDFGHHGGLAAVYARTNTREAIWEALRARRCYGTTGPRILLWTEILRGTTVVHRRVLRPAPTRDARRLRVTWSGARIRGRGRPTRWDGGLRLHDGLIRDVSEWGFETPGQGVASRSEHTVRWSSTTVGDPDGIVLDVDAGPNARLSFETGPATFAVSVARIDYGTFVFEAGGVGQKVEIEWIHPEPGPVAASFEWEDAGAPPGEHAYWVRLLQSDTHAAWSSPIYATVHP
jgi:hypothetical protein